MTGFTTERHPTTKSAAWEHMRTKLTEQSLCYRTHPDGKLSPRKGEMNYGEAVDNAVRILAKEETMTIQQIILITELCVWCGKAGRIT